MKLTKEQLSEIQAFIEKKGIKQIEVKNEILDHVASAVEEKLSQTPTLSIQKAISEVYASFGVFGFLDMEESIQKQVLAQVNQHFWQKCLSFFKTRRIVYPILLSILGWQLSFLLPSPNSKIWHLLLIINGFWYVLSIYKMGKLMNGHSLLANTTSQKLYGAFNALFYVFLMVVFFKAAGQSYFPYLFSTAFTLSIISLWASTETHQWGKRQFKSKYLI